MSNPSGAGEIYIYTMGEVSGDGPNPYALKAPGRDDFPTHLVHEPEGILFRDDEPIDVAHRVEHGAQMACLGFCGYPANSLPDSPGQLVEEPLRLGVPMRILRHLMRLPAAYLYRSSDHSANNNIAVSPPRCLDEPIGGILAVVKANPRACQLRIPARLRDDPHHLAKYLVKRSVGANRRRDVV